MERAIAAGNIASASTTPTPTSPSTSTPTTLSRATSSLLKTTTAASGPSFASTGFVPNATQGGNTAGASGADTGFKLSHSGLVAIIVVVVLVVVFGIASAVLFYFAKKRQWEIRKTLKRVSRRLTGRGNTPQKRDTKRHGTMRMRSPPRGRGGDVEKGTAMTDQKKPTAAMKPKAQQQATNDKEVKKVKAIAPPK